MTILSLSSATRGEAGIWSKRIGLVFAATLLLSASLGQAQDKQVNIVNTLPAGVVTIIDASAPGFTSEVESLLGPVNSAAAKSLLPYSFLLTNTSKQNIWSFTTLWEFPSTQSPTGKPWTRKCTTANWGPTNAMRMLAPADSYLILPLSDLSARKYADGRVYSPPPADEGLIRYIQQFSKDFLGSPVNVQIDSVIFDDGTLIGADDDGTLNRVNLRVTAEKDLMEAISPLSGKDLKAYLADAKKPGPNDEYYWHRANRSEEFEKLISMFGERDLPHQLQARRYGHWFNGRDFVVRKGK